MTVVDFFLAATNNWLGQLTCVRSQWGAIQDGAYPLSKYCGTRFGVKAEGLSGERLLEMLFGVLRAIDLASRAGRFLVDHETIWVMVKFCAFFLVGFLRPSVLRPITYEDASPSRLRVVYALYSMPLGLGNAEQVVPCRLSLIKVKISLWESKSFLHHQSVSMIDDKSFSHQNKKERCKIS